MIALATPDDLHGVYDLLRLMHSRVNEAKALGVISSAIDSGGCLISKQRDLIVGSAAVIKREIDELTDNQAFFTRWFFVNPSHRADGHATRLIEALKQASRNTGVPLFLQVETSHEELPSLRFFKRRLSPERAVFSFFPDKEELAA